MATLDKHQSQEAKKVLVIGDSGSGKTAALASLVRAGYKLRILDWDNGLDILANSLRELPKAKELLESVHFATLTDKLKAVNGFVIPDGTPNAFSRGMNLLSNWKTETEDLGNIGTWDKSCVLVIDSTSFMAQAAFRFAEFIGIGMGKTGQRDYRAVYGEAQKRILECLSLLYSERIKCNVIMNTHIRYMDMPDGSKKGFPLGIGEALSPQIPRFFNIMLQTKVLAGGARILSTESNGVIDLKTPLLPGKIPKELPIETGLADLLKALDGVKL